MYQSCLVYKFTCPGDLINQYIGETERQLCVRIKEHYLNISRVGHIIKIITTYIIVLKSLKRAVLIMIYYLQKLY